MLLSFVLENPQTGQKTQKTGKKTEQKMLKSATSVQKKEKADNGISEADEAIIRAAENYHQMVFPQKEALTKALNLKKEGKTNTSKNVKAVEKIQSGKTEQATLLTTDGRDPSINIFTGNPGVYYAEGDTLNFWSISETPDSLRRDTVVVIQPISKPYGIEGKVLKSNGQDWTFGLIVIGWMIFASLRFSFSKYMGLVFQGLFSYSISSRLYREKGYQRSFGLFRLNLLFYLFLPFSGFLIIKMYDPSMMGFSSSMFYLLLFVILNGFFLLKIFFYWLTGTIFSQNDSTGELIFNMMLYHNVTGLMLLPISTAQALLPDFGMIAQFVIPGLIVLFYFLSLIRSIYFALREGISIFYLILYLCALEILPVILIIKIAYNG